MVTNAHKKGSRVLVDCTRHSTRYYLLKLPPEGFNDLVHSAISEKLLSIERGQQ